MKNYIFYNSTTGEIHFVKKFTPENARLNCEQNHNVSCVLESEVGVVLNKNNVKIDVDTVTLVSNNKQVKQGSILEQMRKKRGLLLSVCDWTQAQDTALSDSKKAEWATYRQALRDVPANNASATSMADVVWPTKPS